MQTQNEYLTSEKIGSAICRECGMEYKKQSRYNNGFCSEQCRDNYREKHPGEKDYQKICCFCGNTFGTNSQTEMYCSMDCRRKAEPWKYPYECVCQYCGESFMARKPDARFCDSRCAARFHADEIRKPKTDNPGKRDTTQEIQCRNCGQPFHLKGRGRTTEFCCKNCADIYRIKHKPPKYQKICEGCGVVFETNSAKQRFCSLQCSGNSKKGRTVYKKTCLFCGDGFETLYPKRKFCTSTCASRYYGDLRRKEYFCEFCGKPRFSDHPNSHHYCSRECALNAHREANLKTKKEQEGKRKLQHWSVCNQCRKIFYRKSPIRKCCSPKCQYEDSKTKAREKYAEKYEPRYFQCAECGTKVVTSLGDKHSVYCSEECMKRATDRQARRQRETQMKNAFVETIDQEIVYRRADGFCAICGLPVPHTWASEAEWAATVDHITPISQGGLHMYTNVQLAHRLCNSLKGIDGKEYKIDWERMEIEDPERWGKKLDNLWEQLEMELATVI